MYGMYQRACLRASEMYLAREEFFKIIAQVFSGAGVLKNPDPMGWRIIKGIRKRSGVNTRDVGDKSLLNSSTPKLRGDSVPREQPLIPKSVVESLTSKPKNAEERMTQPSIIPGKENSTQSNKTKVIEIEIKSNTTPPSIDTMTNGINKSNEQELTNSDMDSVVNDVSKSDDITISNDITVHNEVRIADGAKTTNGTVISNTVIEIPTEDHNELKAGLDEPSSDVVNVDQSEQNNVTSSTNQPFNDDFVEATQKPIDKEESKSQISKETENASVRCDNNMPQDCVQLNEDKSQNQESGTSMDVDSQEINSSIGQEPSNDHSNNTQTEAEIPMEIEPVKGTIPCHWRTCETFVHDENELWKHVLETHFQIGIDYYTCEWKSCQRFIEGNPSRKMALAHFATHSPLIQNGHGHDNRQVKRTKSIPRSNAPIPPLRDESEDLKGIPLTTCLILRNLARPTMNHVLFGPFEQELTELLSHPRLSKLIASILGELKI